MAKQIVSDMETRVGLNMSEAVKSIREMTTAVNVSTSAWKAQEVLFKSSGDYLSAAKAKYDGLGESIDRQQQKIKQLQTDQSVINRDTKEGAEAYDKLQIQIDRATTKMSSLSAQQERAKNSLDTQKSGILGLNNELKNITQMTNSYVERLKAEGNETEAQKQKISGLKDASVKMEEIYKTQNSELERLKSAENQNADAIAKQTVRVNEAATKMAEAKHQTSELTSELNKKPQSWFGRIRSNVSSYRGETEKATKTTSRLSDVIKGSFIGGLAVSGIQALTGKLHDAIKAGADFNKQQDTMKTVWHSLTTEAPKDGQQLIGYINKLGQSTIYSTDTINKMAQSFYHVHSNVAETKSWTNSFVALGSTLHMTNDAMSESGEQFAKIVAGGKASSEDLNVMINRFPMFGEAIQKATGKSMAQLQQMSAQGKLSSTQFEEALDYLGKKYKSGTTEAMTSFQGMSMYLSSRQSKLFGDIESSSFNMSKSVKADMLNLTSDKSMETYAKAISAGIGTIMSGATKALDYISAHKEDLLGVGSSVAKIASLLFKGAWKVVSKTITGIGDAFGAMSGSAKKSTDPVKSLNRILSGLAKHENAIKGVGAALVGAFAAAKLMSGISGLAKGIGTVTAALKGAKTAEEASLYTQKALNIAMKANIFIAIASALIAIGIGFVELYKHNKKFRDWANGIAKDAKKIFGDIVKFISGSFKAIGKFFTGNLGWEKSIGKEFGKIGSNAKSGMDDLGKKVHTGLTTTGKFFTGKLGWQQAISNELGKAGHNIESWGKTAGSFVSKHKTEILAGLTGPFGSLATWFVKDTKTGKSIQKWAGGFNDDVKRMGFKDAFQKQVNDGKSVFDHTKFGQWFNNIGNSFEGFKKSFAKSWSSHWNSMTNNMGNALNDAKRNTDRWGSNVSGWWGSWSKAYAKAWNNHWSSVRNFLGDRWNDMASSTSRWGSNVGNWFGSWSRNYAKNWNNHWNSVRNYLGDRWNDMANSSSSWGSNMGKWWGGFSSSFGKAWRSMWSGLSDFFGGIWNNIKHLAEDGINGVISMINGGIGAIDNLLNLFGSKGDVISKMKPVKLAVGGTVLRHIVVNDGSDSPATHNREIVTYPNGHSAVYSQANKHLMVPEGTHVTNAHTSAPYLQQAQHFADGGIVGDVGNFFGGVWDGISGTVKKIDDIVQMATKVIAEPTKALESLTDFKMKQNGFGEVINDIGTGIMSKTKSSVTDWWSSLWSSIKDVAGDTGGSGDLINGMEKFSKSPYVYGGTTPGGFDCSGLVQYTLKELGISSPRTSGAQFAAFPHVKSPSAGDLAFFGSGGSQHVGVVVGNNRMFSAENPTTGIGFSSISGWSEPLAGYARVPGTHAQSDTKTAKSADKGLLGPLSKQLQPVYDWVKKFVSPMFADDGDGGGGDSPQPKGSHQNWLKQAGVPDKWSSDMDWIIDRESGWNVHATNSSSGAYGIPQSLPGNKMGAFGSDWQSNPITQIKWMLDYVKSRYGGAPQAKSFWKAHHWYANGGFVSNHQIAEIAEQNRPEVIIPLDPSLKPRANQLIEQTNKIVNPESGKSSNTDLSRLEQVAERIESALNLLVGFGYQQNQSQPRSTNAFDTLLGSMQQKGQILSNQNLN